MDRLTTANYADIHSVWGSGQPWSVRYELDQKFQETATYDLRGNIKSMTRKGTAALPTSFTAAQLPANYTGNRLMYGNFGQIDDLEYRYDPNNGNKLLAVNDKSDNLQRGFKAEYGNNPFTTDDYTYDKNGNVTSDLNKGILKIEYNYLNLPTRINFLSYISGSTKDIYFIYDASGQKHRKIVRQVDCGVAGCATTETVYDYVNGIEYQNGKLQRIAHTEGSVSLKSEIGGAESYRHEYVIKDHLGNARVTYTDDNTTESPLGVIKVSEIKQVNHYYGFGLNMEGNWNGSAPEVKNKYQYNEKELNTEFGLDWNDYGARFYDATIARWYMIDPEGESNGQISFSNYHYTFDNPVRFNDPDGKEGEACCGGIGTRILGTLQAVAGATEMAAAAALILAPEPILTKAGGVAVAVHGADNIVAGLSKAFTGKETETLTSQGLQSAGLSKENAQTVDAVIGIAGTGVASAAATTGTATIATATAPQIVKTAPTIQANKAAGDAFRDKVAETLTQAGRDVAKEVGKKTPFGWRRIDIEVSQGGKVLGGIETKVGNSPYGVEQRAKDWYLKIVQNYPVTVIRQK